MTISLPKMVTMLLLALSCTVLSYAQAANDHTMAAGSPVAGAVLELNQAIALSLQHYPSIRSREAQLRSARAGYTEARDQRLPSLTLFEEVNAGTTNNLGASYFSAGIVPSLSGVSARPENSNEISSGNIGVAYLQWQVYNFGAYRAGEREALSRVKTDSMGLAKERFFISSMTLQSYLDLIRNEELSVISLENLQRADTIRNAIRNYVISGLRPGVDSSLAEAEYSKAVLNWLDITNQYRLSKVQLSMLTGLDTAAINPDLHNDSLLLGSAGLTPPGGATMDAHPFLSYFHSIYENGQAREKLISKSWLPKVYVLGAGWMKGSSINPDGSLDKNLSSGLGYTRYNYMAGLGVSYDLFNLKRTKDKLATQRFQTEAYLHDYEEQKQILANAGMQAAVNLTTAISKYREIPTQLNAARDAYRQKLAQYDAGLSNIIDLTNAFYILNRAQTDLVSTRDGVWRAVLQQAYADNGIDQLLQLLK